MRGTYGWMWDGYMDGGDRSLRGDGLLSGCSLGNGIIWQHVDISMHRKEADIAKIAAEGKEALQPAASQTKNTLYNHESRSGKMQCCNNDAAAAG